MKPLFLLGIAVSLLLSACQAHKNPARHVTFVQLQARPLPDANTVRLYFDAHGDLYPEAILPTDNELQQSRSSYFLRDYYLRAETAKFADLCRHYGVVPPTVTSLNSAEWEQVQDKIRAQRLQELTAKLQAQPNHGKLVILIHGFNVSAASHGLGTSTGLYAAVRTTLTTAEPGQFANAVFLEVFWDGLQKETPVGIWSAAQLNARYVGLHLRQLVAGTPPTTPIRVFTHSSGAIVASHTFWNVTSPYVNSKKALAPSFQALFDSRPTPTHPDVRLGLLVPATTGNAFFGTDPAIVDYNQRTPADSSPPPRHVVIGMNQRDYALNKAGMSRPSRHGVTTLGCQPCDYTRTRRAIGAANLDSIQFWDPKYGLRKPWMPETGGLRASRYEAHGWDTYLRPQRGKNFIRFVKLVMR